MVTKKRFVLASLDPLSWRWHSTGIQWDGTATRIIPSATVQRSQSIESKEARSPLAARALICLAPAGLASRG